MNYRNIYDHCNKHLSEKLQLQPATKFVTEIAKTTKKPPHVYNNAYSYTRQLPQLIRHYS